MYNKKHREKKQVIKFKNGASITFSGPGKKDKNEYKGSDFGIFWYESNRGAVAPQVKLKN